MLVERWNSGSDLLPFNYELDASLEAEGGGRLMPSSNRDRFVDCRKELVKYTILMQPY
jgi:hypothetical protein